ncbi:hypothetical protein [Campylobacter sputorum]|uniref:hypothetical protein n=1 Tax=Campylobacter sputorum TaxID=206 RepID=UPI00053BFEC7|nr:hypothetical protein [Campylobacter sputorum]
MRIPAKIAKRKIRYDLSVSADTGSMLDQLCEIYGKEKSEMFEDIVIKSYNGNLDIKAYDTSLKYKKSQPNLFNINELK